MAWSLQLQDLVVGELRVRVLERRPIRGAGETSTFEQPDSRKMLQLADMLLSSLLGCNDHCGTRRGGQPHKPTLSQPPDELAEGGIFYAD